MAVKDVEEYYDKVCNDYSDMLEALHDMEKEAEENILSPDRLEHMRETIRPMKDNYMRISYIMYLLHKPSKFEMFLNKIGIKTKSKMYSQRFDDTSTLEGIRKENKKAIESINTK